MKELIKDKLYSFDEKVRVELGPQIVNLVCTEKNIDNSVTHANYQEGKIDAFGNKITMGNKMDCVDWKGKLKPHLWKVYQLTKTTDVDKKGKHIFRFLKVDEVKSKDNAITIAESLLEEMK